LTHFQKNIQISNFMHSVQWKLSYSTRTGGHDKSNINFFAIL